MTELEKAYRDYEQTFDEQPPLMFLRGLNEEEQTQVINERIEDGRSFGQQATDEDYFS